MRMYVYVFIHTGVSAHVYLKQIHIHIIHFAAMDKFNTGCKLKEVIVFFLF